MFTLPDTIRARPKHQRGVPGPEYGLIVGLCAQVIVGSMITLGTRVIRPFTTAAALP
jgi:Flp pilus assembly pilin Flp